MLPENTLEWGRAGSCIRELSEYGAMRKKEIGEDNVFDFSIGSPSIPAPDCVNDSIAELIKGDSLSLHGYTTAAGLPSLRERIAEDLNERFGINIGIKNLYVTCGAAASLAISLKAIMLQGEEVIVPAPFFPEYRVFVEACGGVVVTVAPRADMQIDLEGIKNALTDKTKALIINSPNNPSGAIFDEENLRGLAELLNEHREKTGNTVYIISDEPYRELVFTDAVCHSVIELYDDTIMCYSFSKSLSVPGERIGYIAVSDRMKSGAEVYDSILGAGRCLGYINPPSLFQRVIERSIGQTSDVEKYRENREVLCRGLRDIGYEFTEPDGAFYLFVKALEPDAKAFSAKAMKHELLLVPSDDFGCTGYVRVAYCVSRKTIESSMPAFKALMDEYK